MDNEHLTLEGGAGDIYQLDGILGDTLVPLGKAGLFGDLGGLHHGVPGTDLGDLLLRVAEIGQEFGGAGLHHRAHKEIPGGGRWSLADDIYTGIHKEAQNPQCGAEHSQNPEQQRGLLVFFRFRHGQFPPVYGVLRQRPSGAGSGSWQRRAGYR